MVKILVVDDDTRMRRIVGAILTDAGHQVTEAEDGAIGVRKFLAEPADLVITDLLMPEQEGIATIRQLRAADKGTAIIAMSGGGSGDGLIFLKMAEQLGANATLSKPFRAEELLSTVDKVLNTKAPVEA